jgi:hypothetical protein
MILGDGESTKCYIGTCNDAPVSNVRGTVGLRIRRIARLNFERMRALWPDRADVADP